MAVNTQRSDVSRPVVEPLSPEEALAAVQAAELPEAFSRMTLFRTCLRQPGVAELWATVVNKLVLNGTLDARLRELVILRVAWVTGGSYEWANHQAYSIGLGMTDEECLAVRLGPTAPRSLSDDDRFILAIVDSILAGVTVTASDMERLEPIVGGVGPLMELLILPGIYGALSSMTRSLQIELDPGRQAWLPDGVAPGQRQGIQAPAS